MQKAQYNVRWLIEELQSKVKDQKGDVEVYLHDSDLGDYRLLELDSVELKEVERTEEELQELFCEDCEDYDENNDNCCDNCEHKTKMVILLAVGCERD
jgi:hypothetical protein